MDKYECSIYTIAAQINYTEVEDFPGNPKLIKGYKITNLDFTTTTVTLFNGATVILPDTSFFEYHIVEEIGDTVTNLYIKGPTGEVYSHFRFDGKLDI